jgi:hypothetical protein
MRGRPTIMRWALRATAAASCVVAISGCAAVRANSDPRAVVQRFVTAGSVLGDGYAACTYLTSGEQQALSRPQDDEGCRQALNAGGLAVGGDTIDTVHALHRLKVRTTMTGGRAWVRLSRGPAGVSFELVHADPGELDEFRAPNTQWRIARGARALVHPAAPTTAAPAAAT